MKTIKLTTLSTLLLCGLLLPNASGATSAEQIQSFNHLVQDLNTPLSAIKIARHKMPVVQQQNLAQAKALVVQMLNQPDPLAPMLALCEQYKTQDTLARQAMLEALFTAKEYTAADLPFLKAVFLASLQFSYDNPPYSERAWIGPNRVRLLFRYQILEVTGQDYMHPNKDRDLLDADPAGWLKKYAP